MNKINYNHIKEAIKKLKEETSNKNEVRNFSLIITSQCIVELENMFLNILDNTRKIKEIFFDIDFEDFCLKNNLHNFSFDNTISEKKDLHTTLVLLDEFDEVLIEFYSYPLAVEIEESRFKLLQKLKLHQRKIIKSFD